MYDDLLEKVADADKILIVDAIKLVESKFYRASYIMAWLACAESLKRKFREAGKRAKEVGRLSKDIGELEKQHKAVDGKIIAGAFEHGFISDTEKEQLKNFYMMRCVYAHPYEEAPLEIDCKQIIENVLNIVLTRPTLLKEGGICFILERLKETSFLNDNEKEVNNYITEIVEIFAPNCYKYFLDTYLKFLSTFTKDRECDIVYKRGIQAVRCFLQNKTVLVSFKDEDIENLFFDHKRVSVHIFSNTNVFNKLCKQNRTIIFNRLIEESPTDSSMCLYLNNLYKKNCLTEDQKKGFYGIVNKLDWSSCLNLKIGLDVLYERMIEKLKSHNWHVQNPVLDYISELPYERFNELDDEKLLVLGRNILQCADGNAGSAISILNNDCDSSKYPLPVLKGIIYECFFDEDKKVRLKLRQLNLVVNIIENLDTDNQTDTINDVIHAIKNNELKDSDSLYGSKLIEQCENSILDDIMVEIKQRIK